MNAEIIYEKQFIHFINSLINVELLLDSEEFLINKFSEYD